MSQIWYYTYHDLRFWDTHFSEIRKEYCIMKLKKLISAKTNNNLKAVTGAN